MIPTPSLSHLSKEDFTRIYEPAEDTFILLDALEADAERLRRDKPRLVVEIGCVHRIPRYKLLERVGKC